MDERRQSDHCIEWWTIIDTSYFLSVSEYEERWRFGRKGLSSSTARSFHELLWIEVAPKVEQLSVEWHRTPEGDLRICDKELYDEQMRRLIGIS